MLENQKRKMTDINNLNKHSMKLEFKLLIGITISFILGGILSFKMLDVFFAETELFRQLIIWTIGLPIQLGMLIAKIDFVRLLFCGSVGKSTFGCWGTTGFWLSVMIYGLIFSCISYLLIRKKLK